MSLYPPSYATAAEFLHTRGKAVPRKKLANNTYLERRTDSSIAMRLHNTDVITYHEDERIVLNTGGWLTVTTKARINEGLPAPWCLSSTKGVWELREGYGLTVRTIVRYTDGITIARKGGVWNVVDATCLPHEQRLKDDRHNTAMQRLIAKYVREYVESVDTTCTLCRGTFVPNDVRPDRPTYVTYGDGLGDTQHLIDHMLDGFYPHSLLVAAVTAAGYIAFVDEGDRGDRRVMATSAGTVKRELRKYLGTRLYVGAKATANGRKPVAA